MTSNRRIACRARQWTAGAGLAAAAAAVIGMGTAHADDGSVPADIGLLSTAESDVNEAFSLTGQAPTDPGFFSQLDAIQTPLLSSDNSFVSGVGESLFNGPDQNLAQASEAFLSAAEAFTSGTPSITAIDDYASTGFQVDGAIFGEIPSTVIGKLTDQIFDIGGFDAASAGAATDSATSASATPDDVIDQAISDLNQGTAVLDAASVADLTSKQADFLANQENFDQLDPILTQLGSDEEQLPAGDQAFLADADEQFVTSAQNVLSADQALVAADQAGDLTGNSVNLTELTVLGADLGLISADFNVLDDFLLAAFTGGLDPSSAADLASSLDPATAIDPSIFADALSSIGF